MVQRKTKLANLFSANASVFPTQPDGAVDEKRYLSDVYDNSQRDQSENKDLSNDVDNAILKIARVLARQAAREDHALQLNGSEDGIHEETCCDIRSVFD